MTGADTPVERWANRIKRYVPAVDPRTLKPNPNNWRLHPESQSAAVRQSLSNVGWVDTATVNERTGFLVDGHDRVTQALERGETVPVIYVDLSEQEEMEVLRDFDAITLMATPDQEILTDLLNRVGFPGIPELDDRLSLLAALDAGSPTDPPDEFGEVDLETNFEHSCPRCGFEFD